ncbi:DUF2839 domain-containing protein [Gloeobacter violaceus]|uniref:Gsl3135 protein n=1 Tax=Gloeobacter violaceus (strain ATCC 29082 / PCC 7421) TaxID=251221 RepID=Q7NGN3_GLOVI|nr:DUF2839 domain-containing protein [Gloeobacter violaceus]BAC91076.1 gsl3135 [Gloeobacter violaceus PCC 7421]
MGESKRRKDQMGALYGNPDKEYLIPGLPITKEQSRYWYKFTVTGTWICIGVIALIWVVVNFGHYMKWWGAQ